MIENEPFSEHLEQIRSGLQQRRFGVKRYGKISSIVGTVVECTGVEASIGESYSITTTTGKKVTAEVVGLKNGSTFLIPYDRVDGIKSGCLVEKRGTRYRFP